MAKWAEIKCERCAEQDALWEGMERALEESDAREARLERWLKESETREATLNDRITMLEEERDALAEARDMMGRLWEKEKAERDALAEQLTETEAAMRKFLKNHDALAKRLARRGSTRRAHRMGGG